jgi:sugar/nucleoside kinase (ribokinase family)
LIAAIGHVSRDIVEDGPPRPGGTVFYSARALGRLGGAARVGTSCAARDRQALIAPLEAIGLPVTWHESTDTTSYRFRYTPSGRRVMRQDAVGDPWSPEQALRAVADASWIHVGALVRTDFPPRTLAALAGEGRRLLVDGQGLVRTAALGPLRSDGQIRDVLRYLTILKLDQEEADTLAGSADPEGLRKLGVPEVIVTLGSKGSFVVTADTIEAIAAQEIAGAVDPTGAGDTYSAAYLLKRSAGAEPVEAARAAAETVAEFLAG